jgi:hypothetical protein
MVVSLFLEFSRVNIDTAQDAVRFFDDKGLEMFRPLMDAFKEEALPVIKYIVYAYSRDSELVLLEGNWANNKEAIAIKVGLPEDGREDVVDLKNETVRECITRYLTMQGDRDFRHLQLTRDLYERLLDQLYETMYNKEGEFDKDKILADRKALADLYDEMIELEERVRSKNIHIYDGMKQIVQAGGEVDLGLGKSKWVRR